MAPSSNSSKPKPVPTTARTTRQTHKAKNTTAAPSTAATASAPASVKATKPVPSKSASSNTKPKGATAQKAVRQKAADTVANKKGTTNIQDDSEGDEATVDKNTAANGPKNIPSNPVSSNNPDGGELIETV